MTQSNYSTFCNNSSHGLLNLDKLCLTFITQKTFLDICNDLKITFSQLSFESPIGFSQTTCFFASKANKLCSACNPFGVQIFTTSNSIPELINSDGKFVAAYISEHINNFFDVRFQIFNTDGTIMGQTSNGLNGAGGSFDIDQTSTGTINLDQDGASANVSIEQTSSGTVNMDVNGASFTADIDQDNASTINLHHDGASADYVILQTGGSGDILTLTVNGASANVDIIQRD